MKYQTLEESQYLYDITSKFTYEYPNTDYEDFFSKRGNGEYISRLFVKLYQEIPTKESLQRIYRYCKIGNDSTIYTERFSNEDIYWTLYFSPYKAVKAKDVKKKVWIYWGYKNIFSLENRV